MFGKYQEFGLDKPINIMQLTVGETFMVWAIRHWVGCVLDRVCPESYLSDGCESVSMSVLASPIHLLLSSVLPNSINLRWASCMQHRELVKGEKNILHSVFLMQNEDFSGTLDFSRTWLEHSVCRQSVEYLAQIADTLQAHNHIFPSRMYDINSKSSMEINNLSLH